MGTTYNLKSNIQTEARKTSNFSLFAPHLQKQIDITRKIAQLQNPDKDVYDVLIDDSLPGITSQHVSKMFKALKHELIPFIQKIKEHGRYIDSSFLTSKSKQFSIGKQKELNKKIAHEVVQFSFKHGRIDTSVHPFTIGIDRTDVRSTSRYKDTEFAQALQATLHEVRQFNNFSLA
jgi:carboxypeptidase Taq